MEWTKRIVSSVLIALSVGLSGARNVQAGDKPSVHPIAAPQAISHINTDFEPFNNWGTLSCWQPEGGSCAITASPDFYARNWSFPGNVSYATITAGTGGGWSDIGRYFRTFKELTNGRPLTCTAWMYLRSQQSPSDFLVHGQLEVIEPASWTYLAIAPFAWSGRTGWAQFKTSTWSPPGNNVFVRVGVTNATGANDKAAIDDVTVECRWTS